MHLLGTDEFCDDEEDLRARALTFSAYEVIEGRTSRKPS